MDVKGNSGDDDSKAEGKNLETEAIHVYRHMANWVSPGLSLEENIALEYMYTILRTCG